MTSKLTRKAPKSAPGKNVKLKMHKKWPTVTSESHGTNHSSVRGEMFSGKLSRTNEKKKKKLNKSRKTWRKTLTFNSHGMCWERFLVQQVIRRHKVNQLHWLSCAEIRQRSTIAYTADTRKAILNLLQCQYCIVLLLSVQELKCPHVAVMVQTDL